MPAILNDELITEKTDDVSSPRGGKYNLGPNPTQTLLMNTDTSQKVNYGPLRPICLKRACISAVLPWILDMKHEIMK